MNEKPYSQMELLERLMDTAKAAIPEALGKDVRDNLRAAVQDVLSDLDVVTREELDVQKAVLSKTRAKVDEMEVIIAELEKRLEIE
jgi:hypothetical protein